MTELSYSYDYLPCQSCVGKNHCRQCGEDIRRALLAMEGVVSVEIDALARNLRMVVGSVNPADVEDAADALGVFL